MRIILLAGLCLIMMTACSSNVPPTQKSPESLMSEGDSLLKDKRYDEAIATWEKVRERFASPEMSAQAELKIADANFRAERYIEAAVAYEAYLKAHPEDQNTQNILYNLGLSYHKEMLAEERDQTTTRNARSAFTTFLTRYPTDPRRADAEKFIAAENDALAGHELHIGIHYQKKGAYPAAIARLEPLITEYPNFKRKDEVYFTLMIAYINNGNRAKADEIYNRLSSEFPESSLKKKTQKLLEK